MQANPATATQQAASGISPAGSFALAYAALGYYVHPCRDKKPLTKHGLNDASADPEIVRRFWDEYPDAQVGIDCGRSGLVVVDLDKKNDKDGIAAFESLRGAEPHGCTLIASTPTGGRHYVYRALDGLDIKTTSGEMARGIDTRAHGGYVIAPSPSAPGRECVEGDWLELSADQLAPPPTWLFAHLPRRGAIVAKVPRQEPLIEQSERDRIEVASALHAIPPTVGRSVWLQAIFAVHARCTGNAYGAQLVEGWSSLSDKVLDNGTPQYDRGQPTKIYTGAILPEDSPDRAMIDSGTLFALARSYGWRAAGIAGDEVIVQFSKPNEAVPAAAMGQSQDTAASSEQHDADRIEVLSIDEVRNLPPVEWLVDGLFPEQAVTVLAGEPRVGKSFLLVDLMCRMIHGMPFLERRTAPGSVIYFAGEGHAGIAGRLNAWFAQNDVTHEDREGRYMAILDGIPTLSKKNAQQVRKIVRETAAHYGGNPALVVIDTLSQGLDDGDENDAKAVSPAMKLLASLKKKHKCTVVVVHHITKKQPLPGQTDGQRPTLASVRGSGAIVGNSDSVLALWRPPTGGCELITCKQKDGAEADPIGFRLQSVETGRTRRDGSGESSCVVVPTTRLAPVDRGASMRADLDALAGRLVAALVSLPDGRCTSKDTLYALVPGKTDRKRGALALAILRGDVVQTGPRDARIYVAASCVCGAPHTPKGRGGAPAPDGAGSPPPPRKRRGGKGRTGAEGGVTADDGLAEQPRTRRRRGGAA